MDITVRWGSSLYPWETENPFIGWAWKPDWRKWIIGNRSVPAVIMLQRRYCTLPQRWDGMSRGCFFLVVSLMFFYIANTVVFYILFSHRLLTFVFFFFSFFTPQPQTLKAQWKLSDWHPSFSVEGLSPFCWMTLKNRSKSVADCVTYLSLLSFWPLDPSSMCLQGKAKCLFHSFPAFQDSVALSQLKKRHEINVMSVAFSHETPKALSQSHLA